MYVRGTTSKEQQGAMAEECNEKGQRVVERNAIAPACSCCSHTLFPLLYILFLIHSLLSVYLSPCLAPTKSKKFHILRKALDSLGERILIRESETVNRKTERKEKELRREGKEEGRKGKIDSQKRSVYPFLLPLYRYPACLS